MEKKAPFSNLEKGLRQGDPLSPLLFNLVGDGLSRMIDRAVDRGLVKRLLGDFRRGGIVSLQYADDTILFSKAEESALENLKCILMWYEQLAGMKVNFHKSELVPMNQDLDDAQRFAQIFSCPVGSFHLKYLGVPLHFGNLSRDDIQPLVDKILKRIAGWRGKLLSLAARTMLIHTCLASIPVYLLSFIKFPKWAVKLLNTHMANCLWNDSVDNHKYHLANWEKVSMCKEFGGLGIPNLRDLNICLLGSWLKRYNSDKEKLWKELIDFKYNTQKPNIFQSRSSGASNFFKGFMWAAQAAKMGYRWKVGNGRKLRLWEDSWLGSSSLAIQFWPLYRNFNEKNKSIAELWDGQDLKRTFRRNVREDLYQVWLEVVALVSTINLTDEEDEMVWLYNSSGVYSSQSLYKIINFRGIKTVHVSALWHIKIPPRVHFFLWQLINNKVLTRDNLAK